MSPDRLKSMPWDDSDAIFKRSDLSSVMNQTTFNLNLDMIRLFVCLDGKAPIKSICKQIKVPHERLKGSVAELVKLGLIEPLEKRRKVLDPTFFKSLSTSMARSVGPIASILVDDAVADLGYKISNFPVERVAELINVLSMEIQQEEKRLSFQENMMKKLNQKGFLNL